MFKNALVYRISHWQPATPAEIEARLDAGRFVECGASQPESAGWVEPRGEKHAPLIESVGGQWMLTLCTERKAVPSSVIKDLLEERLAKIEADTGRRPRGKQAKELKEAIVHELLPRAFPKRATTRVWVDPAAGLAIVGAGSTKKGDTIASRLVELLGGGIVLTLVQTTLSPAVAMAEWLQSKEAPAGFTVDRECELKQPDSEKATVKYLRHTLEIDEVAEHIAQGKVPTQLAMTWRGRVSFVLTEALTLKKISLLDVVLEGTPSNAKGDNGFDADVALTTGEIGRLLPELIDALGGERAQGEPDAPSAEVESLQPLAA